MSKILSCALPMNRRDELHESLTRRRNQLRVPRLESRTRIARPSGASVSIRRTHVMILLRARTGLGLALRFRVGKSPRDEHPRAH
jgi:hypothetical protein